MVWRPLSWGGDHAVCNDCGRRSGSTYASGNRGQTEALAALCRTYGVTRLEVFGSAARGADFDPARSDMDFLVTFALSPVADDVRRHLDLANALESLLGRSVDLVERQSVETSRN
jgi:predicted nucleotidyltransferase